MSELEVLASGSTRSKTKVNWHLLPVAALRAYEERMSLGAEVHGPRNWQLGQPWSVIWNHMMEHMMKLREQIEYQTNYSRALPEPEDADTIVQNAAAVMWGAGAMIHFLQSCGDVNALNTFWENTKKE